MVRATVLAAMVLIGSGTAIAQQRPAPTPGPTADPATTHRTRPPTRTRTPVHRNAPAVSAAPAPVPPLSPSGAPPDVVIVPK